MVIVVGHDNEEVPASKEEPPTGDVPHRNSFTKSPTINVGAFLLDYSSHILRQEALAREGKVTTPSPIPGIYVSRELAEYAFKRGMHREIGFFIGLKYQAHASRNGNILTRELFTRAYVRMGYKKSQAYAYRKKLLNLGLLATCNTGWYIKRMSRAHDVLGVPWSQNIRKEYLYTGEGDTTAFLHSVSAYDTALGMSNFRLRQDRYWRNFSPKTFREKMADSKAPLERPKVSCSVLAKKHQCSRMSVSRRNAKAKELGYLNYHHDFRETGLTEEQYFGLQPEERQRLFRTPEGKVMERKTNILVLNNCINLPAYRISPYISHPERLVTSDY